MEELGGEVVYWLEMKCPGQCQTLYPAMSAAECKVKCDDVTDIVLKCDVTEADVSGKMQSGSLSEPCDFPCGPFVNYENAYAAMVEFFTSGRSTWSTYSRCPCACSAGGAARLVFCVWVAARQGRLGLRTDSLHSYRLLVTGLLCVIAVAPPDLLRLMYVSVQEAAVLWSVCLALLVMWCFKRNAHTALKVRHLPRALACVHVCVASAAWCDLPCRLLRLLCC